MSKKKILILIVTISVLFIATVSFLIIKNKTDKMEKFEINNNENNEENNTENNTKKTCTVVFQSTVQALFFLYPTEGSGELLSVTY